MHTIPVGVSNSVTLAEYQDGFGIAQCEVINGKFHMIFERRAALDNGKIPIAENWDLGSQVASAFGYNQIIIKQGE